MKTKEEIEERIQSLKDVRPGSKHWELHFEGFRQALEWVLEEE